MTKVAIEANTMDHHPEWSNVEPGRDRPRHAQRRQTASASFDVKLAAKIDRVVLKAGGWQRERKHRCYPPGRRFAQPRITSRQRIRSPCNSTAIAWPASPKKWHHPAPHGLLAQHQGAPSTFRAAVFDGHGNLISAGRFHILAHPGAMPASVRTILDRFRRSGRGRRRHCQRPFEGGNPPDITMIASVFGESEVLGLWAVGSRCRTHPNTPTPPKPQNPKTRPPSSVASRVPRRRGRYDTGPAAPSTEIHQEGIIVPPVKPSTACSTRTCCGDPAQRAHAGRAPRRDLAAQRAAGLSGAPPRELDTRTAAPRCWPLRSPASLQRTHHARDDCRLA